jgi:hypothetical protein
MQIVAKGSKATFCFPDGNKILGIVEYTPIPATGDCWIVTEVFQGRIMGTIYIQQFSYMRLHEDSQAQKNPQELSGA